MDVFDILTLIGGVCLFLFGMKVMSDSLERRAGSNLKRLLGKVTQNKMAGFVTGMGVTAVIQSSSATIVMIVGFINSGLMTLSQAASPIIGANVGTTITAWVLSLSGISGDNFWVQLLKPSSFVPVLALIGTVMIMTGRTSKRKDTGMILLGFSTLMFGMDTMTAAVGGLAQDPTFRSLFVMFKSPWLGLLVGAVLTAAIQSSSASVGVLQALSVTGQLSYAAAVPIIIGQNIGKCVTAIISSIGTNRDAKRAVVVHLAFNVIGAGLFMGVYCLVAYAFRPAILDDPATTVGIAVFHTAFNLICALVMLPATKLLDNLATKLIPGKPGQEMVVELDERLLATPPVALERCRVLVCEMAELATKGLLDSLSLLDKYSAEKAQEIRDAENRTDHYEDILGTYLLKLSQYRVSDSDSATTSKLLKAIGDYERISDHSINILESVEELREKKISFSEDAQAELSVIRGAITEILELAENAFKYDDFSVARSIEPLEQVVDELKTRLRDNHIQRLKAGRCSVETGFVWQDLLTNLERTADHCSNIAICIMDSHELNMNVHETLEKYRHESGYFEEEYSKYSKKYYVPAAKTAREPEPENNK